MRDAQNRLFERKWGVFNHFLYSMQDENADWNKVVDGFDVSKVAKNLHEMGAGDYFITLMQGKKEMIAPNAAFDQIASTKQKEACSKRDLVLDLYEELSKYNIDLYLYFTGDGPYKDEEIGKKFGFINPRENVPVDFVQKWASVLKEYSMRYKDKVKGWWVDGCYDYFGYSDKLLSIYAEAIKSGNPNALMAFNNGVKDELEKWYSEESFVCGEFNDFVYIPKSRFIDGAQAHILAPLGAAPNGVLGASWGASGIKRNRDYIKKYIDDVHKVGGVTTVDIIVYPDGSFDREQTELLKGI